MAMTNDLFSCLSSGDCTTVIEALPSGGGILLVIASSALMLSMPSIRSGFARVLSTSPQGMVALAVGVVGMVLFDGRHVPFFIAVAAAIVCYLMTWDACARAFAGWANRIPAAQYLKRISASTFVLGAGAIIYLFSHLGMWWFEGWREDQYTLTESETLVAITLPAQDTTNIMLSSQHSETVEKVRWEFFVEVSKLLHRSFDHLDAKLELLPKGYPGNEEEIGNTFPKLEAARDDASLLISYRKGSGSPIDLIIEPYFYLSSYIGKAPQINYKLRIRRVDRDKVRLGVWPDAEGEWIRLDGIQNDHRLAALVAIAKVTTFSVNKKYHEGQISTREYKEIWENLNKEFRKYYSGFDNTKNKRSGDWKGNELAKDQECSGKTCVERWIAAYSEELPNEIAAKNLEKIQRRVGAPILQSARDGSKME